MAGAEIREEKKIMRTSVIFLLMGSGLLCTAHANEVTSHCTQGEINYFSCRLQSSEKIISLCGAPLKNEGNKMWLQYRMGKVNAIEFIYPKQKHNSLDSFKAEIWYGQSISGTEIDFTNNGFQYSLTSAYSAITSVRFDGISVTNRKKETRLSCAATPKKHADFEDLVKLLSDNN